MKVVCFVTCLTGWLALRLGLVTATDFPIYWNMPADPCARWGYDYSTIKWNFIKNSNNTFHGEHIDTIYNAGSFPKIGGYLKNNFYNVSDIKNGGVPQKANLTLHLIDLRERINAVIPDPNYSGLAVIDMEDWYPTWALNTGYKNIYRLYSRDLVQKANPNYETWNSEREAKEKFNEYAKKFLILTIKAAKRLRPKAVWGYFEFPYCNNYNFTHEDGMRCTASVRAENEKYLWIYDEADALYPYIYLYDHYNETLRAKHIMGRLEETYRVLRLRNIIRKVYAYANPTLISNINLSNIKYLNQVDLMNSLLIPKVCGTDGVVVWGSSSWFNSQEKCKKFDDYLKTTLGPAVDFATKCSIQTAKQWLNSKGERFEICK